MISLLDHVMEFPDFYWAKLFDTYVHIYKRVHDLSLSIVVSVCVCVCENRFMGRFIRVCHVSLKLSRSQRHRTFVIVVIQNILLS